MDPETPPTYMEAILSCIEAGIPVVAAIALLLGTTTIKEKKQGMEKTFAMQDLITGSVRDCGESGQDHRYGLGRLDILRAIGFAHQRGY
jgi:hypothetical protein